MLGALAAVPAVVALPPALAAIPDAPERGEWDRLFAAYERAKAIDAADNARHEPIWQAYKAQRDAVPHGAATHSYTGRDISTEDLDEVRNARRRVREVAEGRCYLETDRYPELRAHFEYCQRLAAAADEREAEIQRIDDRLGYEASAERNETLGQAAYEAEIALIETPAPDAEALLWKLERLFGKHDRGDGYGASYSGDWLDILLADARHLAERGALA